MPRVCSVCAHPQRAEIDAALAAGESCSTLSARYGTLGRMALERHKANHLPAALVQAQAAADVARADTLLDQVRDLRRRALAILQQAEQGHDLRAALLAIREARGNLELLAKLLGELKDQAPAVNVLIASPEWLDFRERLLDALEPYDDARVAVVEALRHASGL